MDRYLTWDIKENLLKEFKSEMLLRHQQTLLDRQTGIRFLLEQDKFEDLTMLYQLYADHQDYLVPIATAFKEHVLNHGNTLVSKVEFTDKEHNKIKE